MKTTFEIIRVNGTVEKVEAEFSDDEDKRARETLEVLHKVIRPGYIEHVTVFWPDEYADMFVDESGKIIDPPLPPNPVATRVYWNNTIVHRPEMAGQLDDYIAGDAVLFRKGVVT